MRTKGTPNTVRIALNELVARLSKTPDISIPVAKSWVRATEETLNVKLVDATEPDADAEKATATDAGNRAKFED